MVIELFAVSLCSVCHLLIVFCVFVCVVAVMSSFVSFVGGVECHTGMTEFDGDLNWRQLFVALLCTCCWFWLFYVGSLNGIANCELIVVTACVSCPSCSFVFGWICCIVFMNELSYECL